MFLLCSCFCPCRTAVTPAIFNDLWVYSNFLPALRGFIFCGVCSRHRPCRTSWNTQMHTLTLQLYQSHPIHWKQGMKQDLSLNQCRMARKWKKLKYLLPRVLQKILFDTILKLFIWREQRENHHPKAHNVLTVLWGSSADALVVPVSADRLTAQVMCWLENTSWKSFWGEMVRKIKYISFSHSPHKSVCMGGGEGWRNW